MEEKCRTYESLQGNKLYRIEEDYPEVGVYLYVFENNQCIKDYLQTDINTCKSIALEEYNVPIDSWILKTEFHSSYRNK